MRWMLACLGTTFETVIDSGLFHLLTDEERHCFLSVVPFMQGKIVKIPFVTPLAWAQVVISTFIVGLGLVSAHALSQIDADLQILYREYTLAAVDLAHISADVLRYRVTIVRAMEAPTNQEFERLTGSLAMERAGIQHAVNRYAAGSLRVSRSGRSEPQDPEAIRQSLDGIFHPPVRPLRSLSKAGTPVLSQRGQPYDMRRNCMPRIIPGPN